MQSYSDGPLDSGYYDQQSQQQSKQRLTLPPASSFFEHSPNATDFHGNLDAGPSTSSGFGMNNDYSGGYNVDPFLAGPSPGYMGHDPFAYHQDPQGYGHSSGMMDMGYPHNQGHMNMMPYENPMSYPNEYIGPSSGDQNSLLTPLGGMPSVPPPMQPPSQYGDPYANDMYHQQPYQPQPTNLDGSGSANMYGPTPDSGQNMYQQGPPPPQQQGQMFPMASEPMNYQHIPDMAPPYMEMQPPPMQQQLPRPAQTPQTVPSTPVNENPPVEQPPQTPISAPAQASTSFESLKPVDTTIEDTVAEVVAQQSRQPDSKQPKAKKRRYVRSFESMVDQMIPHPDPADGPTVKQHLQQQQLEKRMQEQAARRANKAKLEEEKRQAAVADAVKRGMEPPVMAPPKRTRKRKAPADKNQSNQDVVNLDLSDVEILEQPVVSSAPVGLPPPAEIPVQTVVIEEPMIIEEEKPVSAPKPKAKPKRARKPAAKRETAAQKRERLQYLYKAHHMQQSMRSLVLKNTALVDEVSRLYYRIQAATEERKRLAKQLQHYERNRMRRLQTQKKKQALAMAIASPEQEFHEYHDDEYPPPAPSEPLFDVEEYAEEEGKPSPPSPIDWDMSAYPYDAFQPMPMQVVYRTLDDYEETESGGFSRQNSYTAHENKLYATNVKSDEFEKPKPAKRVRKPRAPKDPNAPPKKRQRKSKTMVIDGAGETAAAAAVGSNEEIPSSDSGIETPKDESALRSELKSGTNTGFEAFNASGPKPTDPRIFESQHEQNADRILGFEFEPVFEEPLQNPAQEIAIPMSID